MFPVYSIFLVLLISFPITPVLATSHIHRGPARSTGFTVIRGQTISEREPGESTLNPEEPFQTSQSNTRRLIEFAMHAKKDVVFWKELKDDGATIKKCKHSKQTRPRATLTLSVDPETFEEEDVAPGVVIIMDKKDWFTTCKTDVDRIKRIDKEDDTLFLRIRSYEVGEDGEVTLKLSFKKGKNVVPIVDVNVHEYEDRAARQQQGLNIEPGSEEVPFTDFATDNSDDSYVSTIGRQTLENATTLPTSADRFTLAFRKTTHPFSGASLTYSGSLRVHITSFRLSRLAGIEFKWTQTIYGSFSAHFHFSRHFLQTSRTGELYRKWIPKMSFRAYIPGIGTIKAGAFLGINWIVEAQASVTIDARISATLLRREYVTARLFPPSFKAVNALRGPIGNRASSSTITTGSAATVGATVSGFAGVRPVIGVGIERIRYRIRFRRFRIRVEKIRNYAGANIGANFGLSMALRARLPAWKPYLGGGARIGRCEICHVLRGDLRLTAMKFGLQLVQDGRVKGEFVFVRVIFEIPLGTICALPVAKGCFSPTPSPTKSKTPLPSPTPSAVASPSKSMTPRETPSPLSTPSASPSMTPRETPSPLSTPSASPF